MLKSFGLSTHLRLPLQTVVVLAATLAMASACQFSGSFEGTRCAQQSDCPADAQCVEGYCVAPADLGDAGGEWVETIQLSPESLDLRVGDSYELNVSALDGQGSAVEATALQWESSDEAVVSVDETGAIEALAVGTAVITASADGAFDVVTISVTDVAAASIELDPTSMQLKPGATQTVQARVLDEAGEELVGRDIRWSSSQPSIAVVDDNGQIMALNPGTTTITATSGAAEASLEVVVEQAALTAIELSPSSVELIEGDTFALRAVVRDEFGDIVESAPITWSSSNQDAVTVDDTGVITAQTSGSATITAQSGSAEASVEVTVVPTEVATITVDPNAATLEVGDTVALAVSANAANGANLTWPTFSYASSDDSIASVDAAGVVQAHQPGVVAITVSAGGVEKSAAISVIPVQAAGLSVSPTSADIEIGGSVQLDATVEDANNNTIANPFVVWESDDAGVAIVDSTGLVVGIGQGSAQITARTENGTQASATVNVAPRSAASIELRPQSATLEETHSLELDATVRSSDGTILEGRTVTYTSADSSIASVDSQGVVTGVSAGGPVAITATSGNATQTVDVSVVERSVVGVEVTPQLVTVEEGSTTTLSATPRAADGSALSGRTVSWSSADNTIASVDAQGQVSGQSPGVTLIYANVDGEIGFASVRVAPAPVATINIVEGDQSIAKGSFVQLSATVRDAQGNVLTGRPVSWTSDDPSVAAVDSSGQVTGIAQGSALITATSEGESANVLVTVTANGEPSATAQTVSTDEETPLDITLSGTDPDGDALSFAVEEGPSHGTLSAIDSATNKTTYTPNADFAGSDSFTFTVSDASGASSTAVVSITVQPVNDAPQANADAASTPEDVSVTVDVFANDTDLDGDSLSLVSHTSSPNATIVDNGDGTLTVTPDANFNGSISFFYEVSDGTDSDTATVDIDVTPVNDFPLADADAATVAEDDSVVIDVVANDTDVDGDTLSVLAIDLAPSHGTAVDNGDGTITYTPDADFNGADFLAYTVSDGAGGFDSTYVDISVTAENDAPTADAGADRTVNQGETVQLGAWMSSDIDADTLTYTWTITSEPSGQAATLSDPNAIDPTFVAHEAGTYVIELVVSDGTTTDTDTVTITSQ